VGVIGIALVAPPVIDLLFSSDYAPVVGLAIPLALGQAVRGVTSVYTNFMSSHGQGRSQRNAAFVLTVSNLVFNFALIPPFGAKGAAWASFLALVFNFAGYQYYYRRYVGQAA
jgi:O-antigen/teichoic acid export membrane protein